MDWFIQLSLSWIVLSVVAACVSCQELRSTLREGNSTCPGEMVNFTCTVRGPSSLSVIAVAWSSTEYIGQGGSLQFSTANVIGAVETSTGMDGSVTATAKLTNNINVAGELILESMLHITAVMASTVTCSGTSGDAESIGFTISAIPGVPQGISAAEISRLVDTICIILVTWNPPANSDASDIDQYIIYIPSRNIRGFSSSTVSTLTVPNCGDDTRVQVAAVNRIGCVGMNSSEVQLTLLDVPAGPTGSATTEGGSTSSQLGVGAIVGIAVGVILPTLSFLGLFFVCICYVCIAGKPTKVEGMLLREVSRISQVEFQKNLVNFCSASRKDSMTEKDKLSSVESLSQMMENRTLSKLYVKEAIKSTLNTMKWEKGEDVKKVLIYLKIKVPRVLESFDNELQDKGTNITMANLIGAAEQNVHAEVFDELIEIMDNTEPEIVEGHLRTMFEQLQKRVINLSGGEINIMESPTS